MSDFPEYIPELIKGTGDSDQQSESSRPPTSQGASAFPGTDPQSIYDVSTPSTPRQEALRPKLFSQGNQSSASQKSVVQVPKKSIPIVYKINKSPVLPLFQIVDIDTKFAASVLEGYISRGSSLTGVDVNLLDVTVKELPTNETDLTVKWLCGRGIPILDASAWMCADKSMRPELKLKPNAKEFKPSPPVPNFLTKVAGLTDAPASYVKVLCSFNPVLFDARWIQDIKFTGFGQEVMSRFGLGVAGYRMFAPFKLYNHRDGIDERAKPAFAYARAVASSPPTWAVHPVTRDPKLLTERGNLNKNLANLMRHCYSEETLKEMAASKMIYAVPIAQPGHNNWTLWKEEIGIAADKPIF